VFFLQEIKNNGDDKNKPQELANRINLVGLS